MTTTVKYPEVLAAVREYLAKVPANARPTRVNGAYWDIGKAMQVGLYEQETQLDRINADRFSNQIRRALDALATEGSLIKIGKGDQSLTGYRQNTPEYYTPAQHEHAVAKAQQERTDKLTAATRWEEIYDQLERLGIPVQSWNRGQRIVLELDGWDTLLEQLTKGTGGW